MRISDWSSDVCSSDLPCAALVGERLASDFIGVSRDFLATPGMLKLIVHRALLPKLCAHCALPASSLLRGAVASDGRHYDGNYWGDWLDRLQRLYSRSTQPMRIRNVHGCRSEEHTSELQSLMRISYAVFCLTKNKR